MRVWQAKPTGARWGSERESGKARGDSVSHLTVARVAAAKGMGHKGKG